MHHPPSLPQILLRTVSYLNALCGLSKKKVDIPLFARFVCAEAREGLFTTRIVTLHEH